MTNKHSTTVDPLIEERQDVEATRSALTASLKELTDRMNPKKRMHEVASNASGGAKHAIVTGGRLGSRLIRIKSRRQVVVTAGVVGAVVGLMWRRMSRR